MRLNIVLLLFSLSITNHIDAQNNISVRIDSRMEALSIFYILAIRDSLETEEKPTPSMYYKDFSDYFETFKNQVDISWYRSLDSWDGFDIASFGLFLSDSFPFRLKLNPINKFVRSAPLDTFLQHFNHFYKECGVEKFIHNHRLFYQQVCEAAKDSFVKSGILNNILLFYRKNLNREFIVYIDLLNNIGNNAILTNDTLFENKRMFRLAYLYDESQPANDTSSVKFKLYPNIVIHEISHFYFHDFISAYHQRLYNIRKHFLTTTNGEQLNEEEWENELEELLVRAATAKIIQQKYGQLSGKKEIENQAKHFKWVKPLYNLFSEFVSAKNKYKSITDFYPILINFLETKTK